VLSVANTSRPRSRRWRAHSPLLSPLTHSRLSPLSLSLPLPHSLSACASTLRSHVLNAPPLPEEAIEDAAVRWGHILADALAGRRLFERSRRAVSAAAPDNASPQELQCHLQGMIGALLDEVLQGTSPAHVAAKAEQIQTLDICVKVLHSVR
jgi:hypothetical protein